MFVGEGVGSKQSWRGTHLDRGLKVRLSVFESIGLIWIDKVCLGKNVVFSRCLRRFISFGYLIMIAAIILRRHCGARKLKNLQSEEMAKTC